MRCIRCDKVLTQFDTGLHRKLINRGDTQCMCIACLASHFGVPESRLWEKIAEFRRAGCLLFPPAEEERAGKIPDKR